MIPIEKRVQYAQIATYVIDQSRFKENIQQIIFDEPYEIFVLFSFLFSVFADELECFLDEYYLKSNAVTGFMTCAELSNILWSSDDDYSLHYQELQKANMYITNTYDANLSLVYNMIPTSILRSMLTMHFGLSYNRLPRSLLLKMLTKPSKSDNMLLDKILKKQLEGLDVPKSPMIGF